MPRRKTKRISITSPLQPPREKRGRYNLRNAKIYVSDSDSENSVVYVDTSMASPQTANLTRNLRRKRRRSRSKSNNTCANRPKSRFNNYLTNASSQTEDMFTLCTCRRHDKKIKPLEVLYENLDFLDQGQSSAAVVEKDNQSSSQSKRDIEPTVASNSAGSHNTSSSPRADNVSSDGTLPLRCATFPLPEVDSFHPENLVPQDTHSTENEQERCTEAEELHTNENCSTTARVGSSSSYPFIGSGFSVQDQLFRPGSSEMELNSNWEVPVGPLQPDEMCLGDGSHNDNLQVHVIDLGDIPVDFFEVNGMEDY